MQSILILEDDVRLAMQWQGALSGKYRVFTTHGAAQALMVFEKEKIDLCIVDLIVRRDGILSQDGGILFLGRIKVQIVEKGLKVAILGVSGVPQSVTGFNPESHLRMFGAEKFLQKPFSERELIDAVDTMLDT
jgi:DNA-binding response OmpR family regulator